MGAEGNLLGVTETFFPMMHVRTEIGRVLSRFDLRTAYCVIGNQIYSQLKTLTHQSVIGGQIQAGQYLYTILGWPPPGEKIIFYMPMSINPS